MTNTYILKAEVKGQAAKNRELSRLKRKLKAVSNRVPNYIDTIGEIFAERQSSRSRARVVHLAYGFIKGTSYLAMEPKTDLHAIQVEALIRSVAQFLGVSKDLIQGWMQTPIEKVEAA